MSEVTERFDFDALYEQRLREENQDAHLEVAIGDTLLVVVCDGMGGVQGGSTASRLAVESIRDVVKEFHDSDLPADQILGRAIAAANEAVYQAAQQDRLRFDGMGTTAVVGWFKDQQVHVAWVGDSRLGLLDAQGFRWLTEDHTRVQARVNAGELTPEEAENHPEAHILSRAVGVDPDVHVDVLEPLDLVDGDTLVLTSDGVTGPVTTEELADLVAGDLADGLQQLRHILEVRQGDDNATCVVVRVGPGPSTDAPPADAPVGALPADDGAEEPAEAAVAQTAPPDPPASPPSPTAQSSAGRAPFLAALALLAVLCAGAAWWFLVEGGGLPEAPGLAELGPKDARVTQAREAVAQGSCSAALDVLKEAPEDLARLAPEVQGCFTASDDVEPWLEFVQGAPTPVQTALEPNAEQAAQLVLDWGQSVLDQAAEPASRDAGLEALDAWTRHLWEAGWWRTQAETTQPGTYKAQQDRYHDLAKGFAAPPRKEPPPEVSPDPVLEPEPDMREGKPRSLPKRGDGATRKKKKSPE